MDSLWIHLDIKWIVLYMSKYLLEMEKRTIAVNIISEILHPRSGN